MGRSRLPPAESQRKRALGSSCHATGGAGEAGGTYQPAPSLGRVRFAPHISTFRLAVASLKVLMSVGGGYRGGTYVTPGSSAPWVPGSGSGRRTESSVALKPPATLEQPASDRESTVITEPTPGGR